MAIALNDIRAGSLENLFHSCNFSRRFHGFFLGRVADGSLCARLSTRLRQASPWSAFRSNRVARVFFLFGTFSRTFFRMLGQIRSIRGFSTATVYSNLFHILFLQVMIERKFERTLLDSCVNQHTDSNER